MNSKYPKEKLGIILTRSEETVQILPEEEYQQVTVRLWGKGVTQRDIVLGSSIAASRRFVVHENQFIFSRIDARNGAFGLIPASLEGAVVTNDFPVYNLNSDKVLPEYLEWMSKTGWFTELCKEASEGTTNRKRLKEDKFLNTEIPLPDITEQIRLTRIIREKSCSIQSYQALKDKKFKEISALLQGTFSNLIEGCTYSPMREVAPLVRRSVEIDLSESYYELGVRSFGKGTFHKPALNGADVGTKKLFRIEADDLIFNIVFAWEGAVAVAQPEDHGRYGSHRFLTCVPIEGIATSNFLKFYFLTDEGLDKLRKASPGGAGRNRTLGIAKLENILVPTPEFKKQLWFDNFQKKVSSIEKIQANSNKYLEKFVPSILNLAFKGEL